MAAIRQLQFLKTTLNIFRQHKAVFRIPSKINNSGTSGQRNVYPKSFATVSSFSREVSVIGINTSLGRNLLSLNLFSKVVQRPEKRMLSNAFNIDGNVSRNILVFSHENESFYKFLTFFGVLQMLMWGYLSLSPVQNLRTGPILSNQELMELPWWKRWLFKEGRFKNAISGICLTVGTSILFVTLTYPQRAIRSLWLLKGGKNVSITTYSQFGRTSSLKVPLDHVNCLQSRVGSATQIPLKIKDKHFFFLMDKKGTFHDPEIFDFVVGLKRNL